MRYISRPILVQLIAMEVLFFLLVGVCHLVWPTDMVWALLPLLFLYPLVALLIPLYSFASHGFNPVWPWATYVLFLPPVFIIFNSSALIYGVIYTVISAIGCAIGMLIYRYLANHDREPRANTE